MAEIAVAALDQFGLAAILPHRGVGAEALGAAPGVAINPGPVSSAGSDFALWGVAPGQWLAHRETAAPDWAEQLGETLQGLATVIDQSSGYALIRVSGADAQRVLQKGLPVDLAALGPGAVVVSAIAHIGMVVHWRAADCFEIAVFRSFATSFREWLDSAIAAL